MKIIETIEEMQSFANQTITEGKHIGIVPTMGYLHDGHMSLVNRARSDNEIVVVSIFVNLAQFSPNEDLSTYPHDLEADKTKCEDSNVDVIFCPNEKEMYPSVPLTWVNVDIITKYLCGINRPNHFKGVTTIVAKLFNIVKPSKSYFGQKDYQQNRVIIKMVEDLNFDVKIITCPIIREKDGLAMSSRNKYLDEKQRKEAVVLNKSLERAKWLIARGETNASKIEFEIKQMINKISGEIDYIEIRNAKNLYKIELIQDDVLIALAVTFDNIRLIDNIIINNKKL
ncbi:MAG: pantoate--beta-alanine ligase [Candidatus Aenigmarchaeota archaeon]|nr:pantoate--beta-alanine ligase [Candidatus Aenigmarchaeota archaeon]